MCAPGVSCNPYEQNHHEKHACHYKKQKPLETCCLGGQRIHLSCTHISMAGACQAMLYNPLC